MEYIALALSLVAVILCIVILTKVNKLLTMLRTPLLKKLTPDMNLKPASRRPISAQELAQRGARRESRQNNNGKHRPAEDNRDHRAADKQQQPARDRNEQRDRGNRRDRRDRREGRREQNVEAQNVAAEAQAPAAAPAAAPEARRPLAPRIPVETPAAPAVEAPVAAPAAPAAEPAVEAVETTFDPSKVRYGRRNVIKKAPELADED